MANPDMVINLIVRADILDALMDLAKPEGCPNSMRTMFGETIESRLNRARWEGREDMRRRILAAIDVPEAFEVEEQQ